VAPFAPSRLHEALPRPTSVSSPATTSSRHRHHGDQCEIHRKVIKDLDVFHDALAKGTELPAFELTHGLDALLLYYLVDDLFNPAGLASLAKRAAHDSWRLK